MEHLIKFGRNKDATIFSDIAEQAAQKSKLTQTPINRHN